MSDSILIDTERLIHVSEKYEGEKALAYFIITEYCKQENLSFRERIEWLKEARRRLSP